VPFAIAGIYAVLSLVTFISYGIDKSAARKGARRTPEAELHVLSLLGGWPGALIAQRVFRHKTRKQPFRAYFWVTVVVNCVALVWLLTRFASA
jgi:uncharacterized membrane protein YsdA (DUF1294 family)